MKFRRIDYTPKSAPHNIRVTENTPDLHPVPNPISMAFVSLGKTENPEQDWRFKGGRAGEDGAQGFFFEAASGAEAVVWLECPDDSLTVAEQIGSSEVCIVCIPRATEERS